ncbi:MAG TPA: Ig-like domain-containing protein [Chitinophagales bacterium]|nr:Ig-like domain-containing protein [Chitinophagales bacterium]
MKKLLQLIVFVCGLQTLFAQTAPVAVNDTFTVSENSVTFLPVTYNDGDADADLLSIAILTTAPHGATIVANGTQVLYTPVAFYFGPDSFSYVLCDTTGLCDTATVYITVSGTNAPPVPVDDNFVFGDTVEQVVLPVLANDYDVENDSFFIVSVFDLDTNNSLGEVLLANGEMEFSRNELGCGSETFGYLLCQMGGCDTGLVTVTLTCPDKIFLPEGFSPDGDGINDKLVFTGLEYFSPASLKVFNRYGSIVYENSEYDNSWQGTSLESGNPLPDGTYFYVLQLPDKKKYNSYLVINR